MDSALGNFLFYKLESPIKCSWSKKQLKSLAYFHRVVNFKHVYGVAGIPQLLLEYLYPGLKLWKLKNSFTCRINWECYRGRTHCHTKCTMLWLETFHVCQFTFRWLDTDTEKICARLEPGVSLRTREHHDLKSLGSLQLVC